MDELSVVGLDLATGLEVVIEHEREVPRWRRKGYRGDRSLVCLHCYHSSPEGSRRLVPLVARGRVDGVRRAHFAHPPGTAPLPGEHHPETVWHAAGKQYLAAWARRQPGVRKATVETWTADRRRRSDVRITFTHGRVVALELQYGQLTDGDWLDRHTDYRDGSVVDVWLWHPRAGVPGIVHNHGYPGWLYGENRDMLHALVAHGHRLRPPHWWTDADPASFFPHWPAHPGDRTFRESIALHQLVLTDAGLRLPADLVQGWAEQRASATDHAIAADAATRARAAALRPTEGTTPPAPLPRPPVAPPWSAPRPSAAVQQGGRTAVIRLDAQPPGRDDPTRRRYLCRTCGGGDFGTAELNAHTACVLSGHH